MKFAALLVLSASSLFAGTTFVQNFEDISTLVGSGWYLENRSPYAAAGISWGQGLADTFLAQAGTDSSYIEGNFRTADSGSIDLWLLTPTVTLSNDSYLTFWTRSEGVPDLPDSLKVLLSTAGSSTASADFTTALMTINAGETSGGYPTEWTEYVLRLTGITGSATGRFAFNYAISDVSSKGDYIGIDSVSLSTPEPATWSLLLGAGALAAFVRRRRASRA